MAWNIWITKKKQVYFISGREKKDFNYLISFVIQRLRMQGSLDFLAWNYALFVTYTVFYCWTKSHLPTYPGMSSPRYRSKRKSKRWESGRRIVFFLRRRSTHTQLRYAELMTATHHYIDI